MGNGAMPSLLVNVLVIQYRQGERFVINYQAHTTIT